MDVVIDKFGRIVIPKSIRHNLGLKPGSIMQITEQDHSIVLKKEDSKPPIQRKGNLVVFTGEAVGDIETSLKNIRDKRLKDLSE